MSFDVFKFVALRPPEATDTATNKNTISLASVSASEALGIFNQINGAADDKSLQKTVATLGLEKSLSALLISGVDAALINKVITLSDLADNGDLVVIKNKAESAAMPSAGTIASSLHIESGIAPRLNPNLSRFFRNSNLAGVLNEGSSASALNEGSSASAINEGSPPSSPSVDNAFNEGPLPKDVSTPPKVQVDITPSFFRPVGVGELQVVQQELHRYELGEIAYIENVMASEFRERLHKQSNEQEITLLEEEENEEYMNRNLQSSERFELQTASKEELDKRSKTDLSYDMSASYGTTVEVKAGLKFSMDNAKRSSNERSSQFAQEVIESAVQRTQARVKQSRNEITRSKTEQSNVHRFDNTKQDAKHIAGVYRYVDKIYNMRLVNRGLRFFYEFYIPSPGAYLRQLSVLKNKKPALILPPKPSIKINDISPSTYQRFVEQYGARNVAPPPTDTLTLTETASDADDSSDGSQTVRREGSFSIEKGYEVKSAEVTIIAFKKHSTDPEVWITLGSETIQKTGGWPSLSTGTQATVFKFNKTKGQRGTLGYLLYARHDATVQFVLQVKCEPTEEALLAWQHKVYDAIFEAYQAQLASAKAEYSEKMAGLSVNDLIDAPPARLREVERDELKRLCLQIMGGEAKLAEERVTSETTFDMPLVVEAGEGPMLEGNLPIDRSRLDPLAVEARFAEQAFEWSNMSFTLYPYYWNEPGEWRDLVSLNHPDPLHANFLRSGIARVLVPVRPNYEEGLRDFVYRGRPALYSTQTANITDERWLPLHQEMKEATQRRQQGDVLIDTWLARVSTPLVMLDANVSVDEHGNMMQRKSDQEPN